VPKRRILVILAGLCVVVPVVTVVALNTVLAPKVERTFGVGEPAAQVSGWTGVDLAPAQLTNQSIDLGPADRATQSIFLESIKNTDTNKPVTGISCNSYDQLLLPPGQYELSFYGSDLMFDSWVDVQVVKGYHSEIGKAQFSHPNVGVLNQGNPPSAALCGEFPPQADTYATPTSTP
jgi:hypothetical protein